MFKLGVCGNFGKENDFSGGQIIKTKTLTNELKSIYGLEDVITVNTYKWKRNPLKLILKGVYIGKKSNNIIILPSQKGISVIAPLFVLLKKIFSCKVHYVVIGGWLPNKIKESNNLRRCLLELDGIYVETHSMKESLIKQGIKNVYYMPNFKRLKIIKESELIYNKSRPFKLCTFSRVSKQKGIENAIESVKKVNESLGYILYELDIYGQIEAPYLDRFNKLMEGFPSYVSYKGIIPYNESVDVLKNYYALLFPTYYEGEGFAGTILDAFSAGVPVIATNWRYNGEIINHLSDGLLYDYKRPEQLQEILIKIIDDEKLLLNMKAHCIERAKEYEPNNALRTLLVNLEE